MTRTWKRLWGIYLLIGAILWLAGCSQAPPLYSKLSTQNGVYTAPQWSPDGKEIVFLFLPSTKPSTEIVASVDATGQGWKQFPINPNRIGPRSAPSWWSANTLGLTSVSVFTENYTFKSELVLYDIEQKTESVLSSNLPSAKASWNSSQNQVALILSTDSKHYDLFLYEISTDKLILLYSPPANERVEDLQWSRSGTELAYTVVVDNSAQGKNRSSYLEILNLKTGLRTKLFDASPGSIESPTWSPDGEWIAMRVIDTNYTSILQLIQIDTQRIIPINESQSIVPVDLNWSPTSNQLAVTSLGLPGTNDLYLFDLTKFIEPQ